MCRGIFILWLRKQNNLRSLAAQAVELVVEQGQSLSNVLPAAATKVADKDKALLQELCFKRPAHPFTALEWLINKLMSRPNFNGQAAYSALLTFAVGFTEAAAHPRSSPCAG